MRILLDTHVWLWLNGAPERLSQMARDLLHDGGNELYLSAASAWEIGIKHAAGKLSLPMAPEQYVPMRMAENGVLPISIHTSHALRASILPPHHRDPFDRMLVAQALVEGLQLITADARLGLYEVSLLAAS
jgi:PIN domain nuclease of toxin-antitoxin system